MKVTVVGAGNVGATIANVIAMKNFASEIVLLDVREGYAEGKATDMMQSVPILGVNMTITGVTNDYAATAHSKVVVITSGVARKPGMTREELAGTNAKIVKDVVDKALEFSPEAIFIVISNPMDAMTYLTAKITGLPRNRIIGLGGMLDGSRFRHYLAQALRRIGIRASSMNVHAMVIGGHNDKTMVPLVSYAAYGGIPMRKLLPPEVIADAVAQTKVGGATLTQMIGTSAWYAPGAAVATMVGAICTNAHRMIPCCVFLDGEYGVRDLCIGVPVILGETGVERIVDIGLEGEEKAAFERSVAAAREVNAGLASLL